MKYCVADAFTDELFRGNPAGVCVQDCDLPDGLMQKIAFENNLAETAFVRATADPGRFLLRWFTPEVEIDLCGHATLATAFVLMQQNGALSEIAFETRSGTLTVCRDGDLYTMDFPARPPVRTEAPAGLAEALGCRVLETHCARDLLVLAENEAAVRELKPDLPLLGRISRDVAFAVIVTAKGDSCDFVSRFFAPNAGIPEDPVTGSSHSTLIPFWAERLHKQRMTARQLSRRGGTLCCEALGARVRIGGKACCYLTGEIHI